MLTASDLQRISRFQRERALRLWRMKRPFVEQDAAIRRQVEESGDDAVAMSSRLVEYFWHAQRHYLHRHGTLAYYPGWPSIYGAKNDAVEGVTRLMPLWAAYASSPLAEPGLAQDMWSGLRTSLVHGTDPAHPGYWGDIVDRSTLICEAADVALAVWLARDQLWPRLSEFERQSVLQWLRQAVGKRTADNNWHLFVVTIDAVLAQLDPAHGFSSGDRLGRVQAFQVPSGCFTDGPAGAVDFYNAWGFHYSLFWLAEMRAPGVEGSLAGSLGKFAHWFQWLFTARGLPLFGRSLCYRFAACAPLLGCALGEPQTVARGVALSAYLRTWQFFAHEGALRAGRPTQGVFGEDIRWLDPYSGPASSLWGTRSLVMFMYSARKLDWSAVAPHPLPAMCSDVVLAVPGLNATVHTNAERGESVVEFERQTAAPMACAPLAGGWKDRPRELVFGVASRPANNLLKAGHRRFSSSLCLYR